MIDFFNSNFLQTLVTLLIGVGGFYFFTTYNKAKKDRIKSIAVIIKTEIDELQASLWKIADAVNNENVYQTQPLYQKIEWFNLKNEFTNKISSQSFAAIDQFYLSVLTCESARSGVKNAIYEERLEKIKSVQRETVGFYARYAEKNTTVINVQEINQFAKTFEQLYNGANGVMLNTFSPNTIVWHWDNALSIAQNFTKNHFSNTPAYTELCKIATGKK
jgi:hypothetical protein